MLMSLLNPFGYTKFAGAPTTYTIRQLNQVSDAAKSGNSSLALWRPFQSSSEEGLLRK